MFHNKLREIRVIRLLVCVVAVVYSSLLMASENEIELNGFRLQQFVSVVEPVLGPSFRTMDVGDFVANAYQIDDNAYMVISYNKKHPNNISTLQLTGTTNKARPFRGLVLGDAEEKVVRTLGKPDKTTKIDSPNVTKYTYEDRNYSVELDEQGRLYSIQIATTLGLMSEYSKESSAWPEFKAAVMSKDYERILEMLRPDVEMYKSGRTLSINTRYNDFRKAPDKDFIDALIGDKGSVLQEISKLEPEQELRLVLNYGIGRVFKFRSGKILNEIVFFPYNGKYRVYEVAFRDDSE